MEENRLGEWHPITAQHDVTVFSFFRRAGATVTCVQPPVLGEPEEAWAVRPLLRDALVLARRPDGHWRLFSVAVGYDSASEAVARRGVALMPLTSENGNARCLWHESFRGKASRRSGYHGYWLTAEARRGSSFTCGRPTSSR